MYLQWVEAPMIGTILSAERGWVSKILPLNLRLKGAAQGPRADRQDITGSAELCC